MLELQIASPVQWVKGLETLYADGVRTFVEVGPKRRCKGFVDDVLAPRGRLVAAHQPPQDGELPSFNQALCGLYAAGYGAEETRGESAVADRTTTTRQSRQPSPASATTERKCNHGLQCPQRPAPAVGGRRSLGQTL
jgi:acyl transferase domain-containing protein